MSGNSVDYPFEIKDLENKDKVEVLEKYFSETLLDGFIRIGPKDYWFPSGFKDLAPKIYNMEVKPDDVWVVTFPKTGTTLTQELVWLVGNDYDFEKALTTPLNARFPFIEISMYFVGKKAQAANQERSLNFMMDSFEQTRDAPSPRYIKSHLPLSMLPPSLLDTSRVVYVARDPRDVAVSYYHHYEFFQFMTGYTGDLKQYWNLFIENKLDYAPLFAQVKEAWEKRNHPNLLFLFYEDIIKDMPSTVKRVAEFLGKTVTEDQLRRTCEHLAFDNFKKNKMVNMESMNEDVNRKGSFIRKGKAGGWREVFDDEMKQQAEQWIADNLRDTDLRFPSA